MSLVYLAFTLLISMWNAYAVGQYWSEKHLLPPMMRLAMWSGAIMSVIGFFIVYLVVIVSGVYESEVFHQVLMKNDYTYEEVELMFESIFQLAYLLIIFPLLGSGAVIWYYSALNFVAKPGFLSGGVGAYNTYAMYRNIASALKFVPETASALAKNLGSIFKNKNSVAIALGIVLFLSPIFVSLLFACLSTSWIMNISDEKYSVNDWTLAEA